MAFTDIGSAEYEFAGVNATSYTLAAVAVPNLDANSIGVVAVCMHTYGSESISGVTWGGSAMTEAAGAINATATNSAHIFYLVNPPDNGNKDIVVSWTGTAKIRTGHIVAAWANADTAVTLDDGDNEETGAAQNPDIVSTQAGANELVFSASATQNNGGVNDPTNCTSLQNYDSGGNCSQVAYEIPSGSGNTTHTHNFAQSASSEYSIVAASFKEAVANETPTVALNTADDATLDTTPTVEFTGTDADDDDVRYNVQITDNPDAFTGGSELEDNYTAGGGGKIHLNPTGTTAWNGNRQVDDRPGQSFTGNGGILDKISISVGSDEAVTDGTAYIRVYAHQGTFGTTSEPLNAADPADTPTPNWLAVSDGVALTSTDAIGWRDFAFSGANRVRLTDGTKYVWILDWVPSSTTYENCVGCTSDSGTLTHAGNTYIDGASAVTNGIWSASTERDLDMWFKVYESYILLDKTSGTDTGFVNTVTGGDTDPFNSGEKASFTVQAADELATGVTYYWRVRVTDPTGSEQWSEWAATRSFTTDSGEYTLSVAGVFAASGALARSTSRSLAGEATLAGTLTKRIGRGLAGTLEAAGGLVVVKSFLLALAGVASISGALSKSVSRSLIGAATFTGAVTRSIGRSFAGTAEAAGSLAKRVGRSFAGTCEATGAVARSISKTLAGVATVAGVVGKSVGRSFSATAEAAGTVTKRVGRTFAGTLEVAGTLTIVKTFLLVLSGTMTAAGTLTRSTGKALSGTLTGAGTLARSIARSLAGTMEASGALSALKTFLISLAGAMTAAGTLTRQTGKSLAGTAVVAGSVAKQIARSFAGSMVATGTLVAARTFLLALAGAMVATGALTKQAGKNLAGSMVATGSLTKRITKTLAGTLVAAATLTAVKAGASVPKVIKFVAQTFGFARMTGGTVAQARLTNESLTQPRATDESLE